MSLSTFVDQRHRLRANDLQGRPLQAIVRSIGYEGVEEITPLIYFEGIGRPLSLDFDQRGDLARIAHSTVLTDWVGLSVVLKPTRIEGGETIRLYGIDEAATPAKAAPRLRNPRHSDARSMRTILRLVMVLLILAAALAAARAIEQTPNLLQIFGVFGGG